MSRSSLGRPARALSSAKLLGLLVAPLLRGSPARGYAAVVERKRPVAHLLQRAIPRAQAPLGGGGIRRPAARRSPSFCEIGRVQRLTELVERWRCSSARSSRASSKRPSIACSPARWPKRSHASELEAPAHLDRASLRSGGCPPATGVGPNQSDEAIQVRISSRSCSSPARRACAAACSHASAAAAAACASFQCSQAWSRRALAQAVVDLRSARTPGSRAPPPARPPPSRLRRRAGAGGTAAGRSACASARSSLALLRPAVSPRRAPARRRRSRPASISAAPSSGSSAARLGSSRTSRSDARSSRPIAAGRSLRASARRAGRLEPLRRTWSRATPRARRSSPSVDAEAVRLLEVVARRSPRTRAAGPRPCARARPAKRSCRSARVVLRTATGRRRRGSA